MSKVSHDRNKPWDSPEIQDLLRQRRETAIPQERKNLSKTIQKTLRKLVRIYTPAKVENILKEFADLGRLDSISQNSKPKKEIPNRIEAKEFVKLFENI